uniref:Preprotein translocase, SecY subunit containing protein n=1 Tax=Oryza sativa subsp. japonica TaxID=39947 RepID=Q2QM98_ORYSJ|nr:preprotein translocase, SecY subunit containing protein [Oryza sativa Japonica Group]
MARTAEEKSRARGTALWRLLRPLAVLGPRMQRRREAAVPFRGQVRNTAAASLLLLLSLSHVPLYAGAGDADPDPLFWARPLLAAPRGTVMELGVAPVVTSWVVVRLLAALLFDSDSSTTVASCELLARCLAYVTNASRLVIGIAAALGMCGSGGAGNAALVVLQLFAGGVVVVLADLLHETGYGVEGVSAASLLIATNACERAVSHLFSPVKLRLAGAGPEFEGPVFAVTHRVAAAPPSWRHKAGALLFTLLRLDLPNLSNYMTTCVMFVLAVRLDETHLRRLYRSRPRRGTDEFVPIKLLYTSAMPIMLHASAVSAFCVDAGGGAAYPVGGLVYYVTPPSKLLVDPGLIHELLIHSVFVVASCTLLSMAWAEASRSSAREFRTRVIGTGYFVWDETSRRIDRVIAAAAAVGGFAVGGLAVYAGAVGAIGEAGPELLFAVLVIKNLAETFYAKSKLTTTYS